jgi:hypothetical protein
MTRKNPIPAPPDDVFDVSPLDLADEARAAEMAFYDKVEPAASYAVTEGDFTTISEGEPVDEYEPAERAVAVREPSHHHVVGMATLAAMSEEEFRARIAVMKAGQERLRTIQRELMVAGEDYGIVKGIERPFLHLPGAEKLCNIYGLAVEQIAERVPGDGIVAPPLAYHVRSLVHLGDFDGPIVAQGYGEANSWEDKYRYRFEKPLCPKCGHEMQRGGKTGKMAGKWFCPGYAGGCWNTVEISAVNPDGTPVIPPPRKIDNPDPYGLAETLIQMAAKRSLVAATRRATGTSGLFTQDDDSPSVREQAGDSDDREPVVEGAEIGVRVEAGARTAEATQVQHNRLKAVAQEKGLGGAKIAGLLGRIFGMEVAPTGAAASAAVMTLTGAQLGQLIATIESGEIPAEQPVATGAAS